MLVYENVYSRRKHLSQKLLCPLFLYLQLLCSFPDQILQVRGVLLQHTQHGVNNIGLFALVDELELRTESKEPLSLNIRKKITIQLPLLRHFNVKFGSKAIQ